MNRACSGCAAIAAFILLALAGCGGDGPEGIPRVDTGGGARDPMVGGNQETSSADPTTTGTGIATVTPDAAVTGVGGTGAQAPEPINDAINSPDDDDFIGIDEIDDTTNFNELEDFSDLDEFGRFVFGPSVPTAGTGGTRVVVVIP